MTKNIVLNKFHSIDFNKLTNVFFVGFAFSIPISKALVSLFTALMILSWLAEGHFLKKFNIIKHDKLSLVIFFLIGYSTLSLFWSPDLYYAIDFITRKYWHYLIIPIMLTSFKIEYVRYVINAFLASMFISEIISYGIFFEIWTYNNIPASDPSPFINHIDYSIFLAFALVIIITKLTTTQDLKWKFFYSIYFLTGLSNLFINGGRTGQVAFLFSILVMSFLYFRNSYKVLLGSLATVVLTLAMAYNFSPNFQNRVSQLETDLINMYKHQDFRGSVATRIALWTIGGTAFLEHPLFGTGIGGEMKDIVKNGEKCGFVFIPGQSDYHNAFIQYAVQLGILGLFIPISVFYILFTLQFKTTQYKLLATSFGIIFLLHSLGGFSFHIMNPLALLCTFATLFNAISYQEKILNN